MTTGKKKSKFITQDSVPDDHYLDTFGGGVNRKIPKPEFFKQIRDEAQTFIYPTVVSLQQANLEADPDNPIYVRVAENNFYLYTITSLAPGPNDIELDNGTTATFQQERIPSADEVTYSGDIPEDNVGSALDYLDSSLDSAVDDLSGELEERVTSISDITDLASLDTGALLDGQQFSVGSYLPDTSTGSALLRWRPDLPKSRHDGVLFFSLTVPMFTGTDTTDYRNGVGETDPSGDGVMELVRGEIIYSVDIRIPTMYSSMQNAVDDLHGRISVSPGVRRNILIESGHNPSIGLTVSDGDYSDWIVSSEDPEVLVDPLFTGIFIQGMRAAMPSLSCYVDGNGVCDRIYSAEGSCTGYVDFNCGGANTTGRIWYCQASFIKMQNPVWRNGGEFAYLTSGSGVQAAQSLYEDFDTGLATVQCSRCSSMEMASSTFNNCTNVLHAKRAGSSINAHNSTFDNISGSTFVVERGAAITAQDSAITNLSGELGYVNGGSVLELTGATVDIVGSVASVGLTARNSHVDLGGASFTGNFDGPFLHARYVSSIKGNNISASGSSGIGIRSSEGSTVDLQGSSITGSSSEDLYVENGGIINANGVTTTNGSGSPDLSDTNLPSGFNLTDNGNRGIIWS